MSRLPPHEPLRFRYRNYRGEIADRRVVPQGMTFMSDEYHPEPQWVLIAHDVDKNEQRHFAMADILRIYRPGESGDATAVDPPVPQAPSRLVVEVVDSGQFYSGEAVAGLAAALIEYQKNEGCLAEAVRTLAESAGANMEEPDGGECEECGAHHNALTMPGGCRG